MMENSPRLKRRIPLEDAELEATPKTKAKRCLFGAVNHDDLLKDLKKISEKLNSDSNKRWNFDFAAERPLAGRFEWAKTDSEEVPKAYEMQHLTTVLQSGLRVKSADNSTQESRVTSPLVTGQPLVAMATHGDKENVVNSNQCQSAKMASKRKGSPLKRPTQKDGKSGYRTQAKISEHFQQRKPKSEVRRKLDL